MQLKTKTLYKIDLKMVYSLLMAFCSFLFVLIYSYFLFSFMFSNIEDVTKTYDFNSEIVGFNVQGKTANLDPPVVIRFRLYDVSYRLITSINLFGI